MTNILNNIKNVKILCGAGISRDSGMPIVYQYLSYLFKKTGFNEFAKSQLLSADLPFEFWIEEYENFNKENFYNLIKIYNSDNFKPNKNHLLLSSIMKSDKCDVIYTTNFDVLLEKSFDISNLKYSLLYNDNHFKDIDSFSNKLVKLHGCASDEESICTTLKSIVNKNTSTAFKNIITDMISYKENSILLVLGYSCSDIFDIGPIIENYKHKSIKVVYIEHSNNKVPIISPLNRIWPKSNNDGYIISMNTTDFLFSLSKILNIQIEMNHLPEYPLSSPKINSFIDKYFDNLNDINLLELQVTLMHAAGFNEPTISYINYLFKSNIHLSVDSDRMINILGQCYRSINEYDKSIIIFEQYLKQIIFILGINHNRIDLIFEKKDNYIKILDFIKKDENIFNNDRYFYNVISIIFEIITSQTETNPHKALETIKELEKIISLKQENPTIKNMHGRIENEKGLALLNIKEYKLGCKEIENSINKKRSDNDLMTLSNSLHNSIRAYSELKEYDLAWKNGIECLNIRKKLNIKHKITETITNLFALSIDITSLEKIVYLYKEILEMDCYTKRDFDLREISKGIFNWMIDYRINLKMFFKEAQQKGLVTNKNFENHCYEMANYLYYYAEKYLYRRNQKVVIMLQYVKVIYNTYGNTLRDKEIDSKIEYCS